jgi:ABC-type polar amino acid transport system ATPase subunit
MKLQSIRVSNFQSFGPIPACLVLDDISYLIGPNGSGKTAALQALCRMFSLDPSLRKIKKSDFNVPSDETVPPEERTLWIEADFTFPELLEVEDNSTVAPHFGHMRLDEADGIPRVRYRLNASMGIDGDIEEVFLYVLEVDENSDPINSQIVSRAERNHIQVHYLPAKREPSDHIAFGTNALLGRLLRSVNWDSERETIRSLTDQISQSLAINPSVAGISRHLELAWGGLHKGAYFTDPKITFIASEIESLLRHLSVSFSPGHDEHFVDFSRLSDGQKSMLYLSLVIASQAVGRAVLSGEDDSFDADRLRPPVFTLIALEEPENSLSPHYLGRIVNSLNSMVRGGDAQVLIATHAPSMLRRVEPENIRYLRLNEERSTQITSIVMPPKTDDAHKFVREAVQAFPEVYFSRLVVLGEGDSEEIVLPRLLRAKGVPVDEFGVTITPLGGRHVNHFWRLLEGLNIPYLTLLDLDLSRYQGGWGRLKYVNDKFGEFNPANKLQDSTHSIPVWNSPDHCIRQYDNYFTLFEQRGVYFSNPLDLDFSMLLAFPEAYSVEKVAVEDSTIKSVLGKSNHNPDQFSADEQGIFSTYHKLFKLGSKPAAHIEAISQLSDADLVANMPEAFSRLADAVVAKLMELPE